MATATGAAMAKDMPLDVDAAATRAERCVEQEARQLSVRTRREDKTARRRDESPSSANSPSCISDVGVDMDAEIDVDEDAQRAEDKMRHMMREADVLCDVNEDESSRRSNASWREAHVVYDQEHATSSADDDMLPSNAWSGFDSVYLRRPRDIPVDADAELTSSVRVAPKRKLCDLGSSWSCGEMKQTKKIATGDATVAASDKTTQDGSCSESLVDGPLGHEPSGADGDDATRSSSCGLSIECSAQTPPSFDDHTSPISRRTLYIEYWSRTDECKERKWDHLDAIADQYGCAEDHIFATTLNGRNACLEPNMFPYDTPTGIEHWTLWHLRELDHEQIKEYVEAWIDKNAPHVNCWNYDDNPERSIDIFHVHVYFQVAEGDSVLQGRRVEDLVHDLEIRMP